MIEPEHRTMSVFAAPVRACLLAMIALLAVLPAGPSPAAPLNLEELVEDWRRHTPHPLVGKIWQPGGDPHNATALIALLTARNAPFVLLGEVHDNPHHHLLRAALIEAMAADTRLSIVTEHLRADQAPALTAWAATRPGPDNRAPADDFFRAMQWDKSGWPAAAMFRPLYAAILNAGLPLGAAEPPRSTLRAVARGGLAVLAPDERTRLGLDAPLPADLRKALGADLVAGHCNMLPATMIDGMADAQIYRDANMADAMIARHTAGTTTILLAGNGHVRSDRGVPWHLSRRAPDVARLAVLLLEIESDKPAPAGYLPRAPDGAPGADIVVFTPRAEREDPCERMRAHMLRKG
jgi:uncharacterized iron-regulated protein